MELGTKLNYFKNFMNKLSINFLVKVAVTLVPTIAGLFILVVWRRGEVLELDSGWMHLLCLSPSPAQPRQPSPAQPSPNE